MSTFPVSNAGADKATALLERYQQLHTLTDALVAPLSAEDQVVQSMPNTSPTKWHRAHTAWFFETFLLQPHSEGYAVFDPSFGYLFNSYYEAVGERHLRSARGLITRPSANEISDYREHVDQHMAALLATEPTASVLELVELGIQHEQQHQELLLMDIKHAFSVNPTLPAYLQQDLAATPETVRQWLPFEQALVSAGHDGNGFCFDNEEPRHQVFLGDYELASTPVTNGEWLQFMADGGYETVGLWLSEGWTNCVDAGWQHPAYWHQDTDGAWQVFTLAGSKPLDRHEPVGHVSFVEAEAFARWAGARLPTEFEWEHAVASRSSLRNDRALQSDGAVDGNLLRSGAAAGDRLHPGGPVQRAERFFGDVWEWTASPYVGYPGFAVADGAVGEYNGKFMLNQQVLRGGCALTPHNHIRASYRNFFPTATRWHLSGLRLAR